MSQQPKAPSLLAQYPEETREAADLLKHAVPLMMRHQIPPNPVHYALWYTYSQGKNPDLNRRLDKVVSDFDIFPPETALKLFRDHIIREELEDARIGQQQVIELVDDIEGDVSRSVEGSQAYQASLSSGLDALREPLDENLPNVLNELQQSTQLMQDQQEKFLYRLRNAQTEIQHLRTQLERAHMAATLDNLTQVFNRNAFSRLLEQALKTDHQGLALVMMDIDHFKQFNDTHGHALGDEVLRNAASHVSASLRHGVDWVARYGGEEFVLLFPETELAAIAAPLNELREKIKKIPFKFKNVSVPISISFGATQMLASDTGRAAFDRADEALYEAKKAGRDKVILKAGD